VSQTQSQTHSEVPISLMRGGTLYWIQEKARLIRPSQWNLGRRLPLAIAIAWLPLLILTKMYGGAASSGALGALLSDYRVYARIFLAIPLLMLGQIAMESHFREMSEHLLNANLVRLEDLPVFRKIMERARRMRDAKSPEIVIILAVYFQIAYFLQSGRLHYASWAAEGGSNTPTVAGYYVLFVAHALFLGLLALALWKWIIWIVVLWDLSRLDLQLDSTDGDLTAGLGFLGEVPKAFVPVVLAISFVIGAAWRSQVLEGDATLGSFKLPAALLAVIILLLFFLPLLLFTPKLIKEKKEGSLKYGSLQHLHSLQFRQKWIEERNKHVEELLGTSDVSSLADMSTSFKNVENMKVFPFKKSAAIALLVALALPMIPALTAQIPYRELLKSLLETLH
jgi:hypothetical protein